MGTYSQIRPSRVSRQAPSMCKETASKIRGDALVLPVAIAGRLRALRALNFPGQGLSVGFGSPPSRFGLGERALRRRRQRLAFRDGCGCCLCCGNVGHLCISSRETRPLDARPSSIDEAAIVKKVGRFLHLAYSHGTGVFPFRWHEPKRFSLSFPPRCSRSMPPQRFALPSEVPGLAARRIAADILDGVLHKRRTLDDQLDGAGAHPGLKTLADRDRALMRRLVAPLLRRVGTLGHVLSRLLDRGIPTDAPRAQSALLIGAAQILWMDVPDHAAVDLSVRLVQSDRRAAKYAGLVNAVLRRCAREGHPLIDEGKSQTLDTPPWLLGRWIAHYGETTAREMALAIGHEPSLDITVKSDAPQWATRLHGETLPTGTGRTLLQGSVTMLPGFTEGHWWVQDAAAALPARLFGDIKGKTIVDLCAAPGGKTAQLAAAGARVTAVDRSPARLVRLRENLTRLSLRAETIGAH